MELVYHFRGLAHYDHGREHGNLQADVVLEEQLTVLPLDLHVAGKETDTGPGLSF